MGIRISMFTEPVRVLCRGVRSGQYDFRHGEYFRRGVDGSRMPEVRAGGCLLKDSRSVSVHLGRGIFLKDYHYRKRGLANQLVRTWICPRSYMCLAAALRLKQLGVPTPEVLIAGRTFLATEALSGETAYLDHATEHFDAAVRMVAELHRNGLCHRDLSLRNLYQDSGSGKIGLIDLDSAYLFCGAVPEDLCLQDAARLASSYLILTGTDPEREEPEENELAQCLVRVSGAYSSNGGMAWEPEDLKKRTLALFRQTRVKQNKQRLEPKCPVTP